MDSNAANDKAVLDKQATVANQSTESLDNLDESELDPRKASKLPAAKKKKKKTKKKDAVRVTKNDSSPTSGALHIDEWNHFDNFGCFYL